MMHSRSPAWALLRSVIAPFRAGLAVAALAAVAAAATEPVVPWLINWFTEHGLVRREPFPLWWIPVALIGLFVLRGVSSFSAQYALAWVAQRALEALRARMFAKLMVVKPALFREQQASQLINTVVYEAQTSMQMLVGASLVLVRDSLVVIGLLGYLLWLNWQLAAVLAITFPAIGWIMRIIGRALKKLAVAQQQAADELGYAVEENTLAHRVVRVQNAQAQEQARFAQLLRRTRRIFLRTEATAASGTPVTQIVASIGVSVVVVFAVMLARSGTTNVGEFMGFITAMLMLISPIKQLSNINQPVSRGLAGMERVVELLDAPEEVDSRADARREPVRAGGIRFEQVRVSYREGDAEQTVIDALSLDVPPGQRLALVGASGAGKTTLVNLLPRFVEPSAGRVLVDGTDIRDWHLPTLRRAIALVSQDTVLFNESIAHNVAFGDVAGGAQASGSPNDLARVWHALEAAYLKEFVQSLPDGLDTVIGHNGALLSGGQRQRLAIARALYRDAPILILDEATSALDSQSEAQVQKALDRLMQGRTVIVIAHRLSTIEHADRIAVLEGGRLLEAGSHAELLALGGAYARLHALQFGTLAGANA
jgi:subfamily B ATP-binding cassette protein MsbA